MGNLQHYINNWNWVRGSPNALTNNVIVLGRMEHVSETGHPIGIGWSYIEFSGEMKPEVNVDTLPLDGPYQDIFNVNIARSPSYLVSPGQDQHQYSHAKEKFLTREKRPIVILEMPEERVFSYSINSIEVCDGESSSAVRRDEHQTVAGLDTFVLAYYNDLYTQTVSRSQTRSKMDKITRVTDDLIDAHLGGKENVETLYGNLVDTLFSGIYLPNGFDMVRESLSQAISKQSSTGEYEMSRELSAVNNCIQELRPKYEAEHMP